MFEERSEQVNRVIFLLDMTVSCLCFSLAFFVYSRYFPVDRPVSAYEYFAMLPLLVAVFIFMVSRSEGYHGFRLASRLDHAWVIIKSAVISIAILLVILFIMKIDYIDLNMLILYGCLQSVVLILVRVLFLNWYLRRSFARGENRLKVLIIGTGSRARRLVETLELHAEWGIDIVGHLDTEAHLVGGRINTSTVLGTIDDISDVLKKQVIDEVVLAVPRNMISDVERIVDACEEEGVKFRFMADIFDLSVARMKLVNLDTIPLLSFEPVAQDEVKLLIKRMLDLLLIALALPLLVPLMALIALAVKLDSKGPVFFRQQRVGLHKRVFTMYKFRSMQVGSEEKIKELEHLNEADGPIFKIANDPRVTRVGSFIRKTSLDELPQLINVFLGQMSLVGPRPMSIRDVDLFDKGIQRKRFSVKPGLTCIWQVSGRSDLPFHRWLELDLHYIENWSLGLDIQILLKTIPAVIKGSGAV